MNTKLIRRPVLKRHALWMTLVDSLKVCYWKLNFLLPLKVQNQESIMTKLLTFAGNNCFPLNSKTSSGSHARIIHIFLENVKMHACDLTRMKFSRKFLVKFQIHFIRKTNTYIPNN